MGHGGTGTTGMKARILPPNTPMPAVARAFFGKKEVPTKSITTKAKVPAAVLAAKNKLKCLWKLRMVSKAKSLIKKISKFKALFNGFCLFWFLAGSFPELCYNYST
jgi:hypothetical protein